MSSMLFSLWKYLFWITSENLNGWNVVVWWLICPPCPGAPDMTGINVKLSQRMSFFNLFDISNQIHLVQDEPWINPFKTSYFQSWKPVLSFHLFRSDFTKMYFTRKLQPCSQMWPFSIFRPQRFVYVRARIALHNFKCKFHIFFVLRHQVVVVIRF